METLRAEAVAAGTPLLPSAQVVSKVLSQCSRNSSSNDTFLKSAGMPDCSSRSRSRGEDVVRSQLTAEAESSVVLQEQMEVTRKENATTMIVPEAKSCIGCCHPTAVQQPQR
ncbi:hypothetical protein HU200_066947 [Digitaria exilis]|uniref:Uncharacterized protein n=1 Tax=Digitaria exilis TaxID=1010633 RepID=A0A835A5T7_9POAL|nr:hypothetical protein HU200_066947 [Digitaria exilis]